MRIFAIFVLFFVTLPLCGMEDKERPSISKVEIEAEYSKLMYEGTYFELTEAGNFLSVDVKDITGTQKKLENEVKNLNGFIEKARGVLGIEWMGIAAENRREKIKTMILELGVRVGAIASNRPLRRSAIVHFPAVVQEMDNKKSEVSEAQIRALLACGEDIDEGFCPSAEQFSKQGEEFLRELRVQYELCTEECKELLGKLHKTDNRLENRIMLNRSAVSAIATIQADNTKEQCSDY